MTSLIRSKSFKEAIGKIRSFIDKHISAQSAQKLRDDVEETERRYYYMLRLLGGSSDFGNAQDAIKETESGLQKLTDAVEREYRIAGDPSAYYARLRFARLRPEETMESLFADYLEEASRLSKDMTVITDTRCRRRLEVLSSDIFMNIWTTQTLDEEKMQLLECMLTDDTIAAYDRELWLHAVGLGDSFDEGRIAVLARQSRGVDKNMSAVASVWLVIAGLRGNSRACTLLMREHLDEVMSILSGYVRYVMSNKADRDNYIKDLHLLNAQLIGNTPEDATDLSDPEQLIANMPPEYIEKIKKFTEAQLRGDDVFAPTLGRLRHYPFFNTFSNWFLPFHIEHSELSSVVDSEGVGMASMLEKANNLCDSDKYALVLSMENTPDSVRNELSMRLYETISGLGRSGEEVDIFELQEETRQMVISRMLKNMARVAHHSPHADAAQLPTEAEKVNELVSSLRESCKGECDVYASGYETLVDTLASVGHNELAAKMYERYAQNVEDDQAQRIHLLEKSARSYKAASKYDRAYNMYRWAIETEGYSADYDTATSVAELILNYIYPETDTEIHYPVKLLEPFAQDHTYDADYQKLMCRAYMYSKDWEQALRAAYTWEYCLPEGDSSVKSSIVHICLKLGDFEQAADAFDKIPDDRKDNRDIVEYAVACWYNGKRKLAIELLQRLVEDKQWPIAAMRGVISEELICYSYEDDSALLIPDMLQYNIF